MTVVVSDTSPIVCLAHLELLEVLPRLFGAVLIPPAVANELRAGSDRPPKIDLAALPFVEIRAPSDRDLLQRLLARLDVGEAEALALAVEVKPDVVLIDERTGRTVASELGLLPLGVLGVLIRAKRRGLVSTVAPLLTRLVEELDFRISADVARQVLNLSGE